MAVGIVGGASKVHPAARANLAILGVESAKELGGIMAAAGLAQNLGAMRALANRWHSSRPYETSCKKHGSKRWSNRR